MSKILLTGDFHLKAKHHCTSQVEGKVWDRWCQEKLNTLQRLPAIANKYGCDWVVIAGDIFDTSNPPEALKAEFCKLLNSFYQISVIVITGRPGDHDYVSENNYVMMDLKESYDKSGNIYIHNSNYYSSQDLPDHLLISHEMIEGVSDLYKKSIPLSDARWKDYKVILLGDYHGFLKKEYADKTFIYAGTPYPTRYGEEGHSVCIIDMDDYNGTIKELKRVNLNTYQLLSCYDGDFDEKEERTKPFILKYQLVVESKDLPATVRKMNEHRKGIMKNPLCMDVIWEIKTNTESNIRMKSGAKALRDVCLEYIQEKCSFPKSASKLFQKLEAEV